MSAGVTCVRYLLFVFNVLFLLAGIALIVVGVIAQIELRTYASAIGNLNAVAIFLIAIGGIISVISFFGCCGAMKKNNCMLITFAVFMTLMLLLLIAGVITAFVAKSKVNGWIEDGLTQEVKGYDTTKPLTEKVWDAIQKKFECCGIEKYTDWKENKHFLETASVPDSCCKTESVDCGLGQLKAPIKIINTEGCLKKFEDNVQTNLVAAGSAAAGVAVLMFIGIILACCVAQHIRNEYQTI